MPTQPASRHSGGPDDGPGERFAPLLQRFLFFNWLFADMTRTSTLFERQAAWRHNCRMRRYLPVYLQRWAVLTVLAFGLGWLFERTLGSALVSACFFTGACMTLIVMVVISILWIMLSDPETG